MAKTRRYVGREVPLPVVLEKGLGDDEKQRLREWWAGLRPQAQARVVALCRPLQAGEASPVGALTIALEARFVDTEKADEEEVRRDEERAAVLGLFEYVANNPELRWQIRGPTFHICRAHPKARQAVARGLLRADFRCPYQRGSCPMRAALDQQPGRSIVFEPIFRP